MGRWVDGEMGRWVDGEMGRWGDGQMGSLYMTEAFSFPRGWMGRLGGTFVGGGRG